MKIVRDSHIDRLYLLAHLEEIYVEVGEPIVPGQIVARTGSTGNSSSAHLHLEVYECSYSYEQKNSVILLNQGRSQRYPNVFPMGNNHFGSAMTLTRRDPFNHGL